MLVVSFARLWPRRQPSCQPPDLTKPWLGGVELSRLVNQKNITGTRYVCVSMAECGRNWSEQKSSPRLFSMIHPQRACHVSTSTIWTNNLCSLVIAPILRFTSFLFFVAMLDRIVLGYNIYHLLVLSVSDISLANRSPPVVFAQTIVFADWHVPR